MKYIDEYRDGKAVARCAERLKALVTRPWTIMEICGGQTHAIVKYRLQELLPEGIELVHGPGCPVCVTSLELIDKALAIAACPKVIFCTFGDMLRVPGSAGSLMQAKADGADVRVLYSPMDALTLARQHPQRETVFFGVGFETTAPAIAMAIAQAKRENLPNFSVLTSHFLVPPAIEAILRAPKNRVQGFLAAGHVCTIMGCEEYLPLSQRYQVPIVVTGFEPLDILQGLCMTVSQLEEGRAAVENQYARSVRQQGNLEAQKILQTVFCRVDRKWRGIGEIAHSGLGLNAGYRHFDAEIRFDVHAVTKEENTACISAAIMQGLKKPRDCAAFGTCCTPENPLGAPMVSSEGACAAYFRYQGALP